MSHFRDRFPITQQSSSNVSTIQFLAAYSHEQEQKRGLGFLLLRRHGDFPLSSWVPNHSVREFS